MSECNNNGVVSWISQIEEDYDENACDDESGEVDGYELEFDKETFIEALRQFPSLWDINLASYKDRTVKANAWKCLSTTFRKDGEIFLQLLFIYCIIRKVIVL